VAPCGFHLEPAARLAEHLVADNRLPAGAEVWAVDADGFFVRPGPRLVDGAETVAQILHPAAVGAPAPDRARRVDRNA
jgi:iron complex transport system substrate-binding protein